MHEYALSCVGVLLYRRSYLAKNVVSCRDHWIRVEMRKKIFKFLDARWLRWPLFCMSALVRGQEKFVTAHQAREVTNFTKLHTKTLADHCISALGRHPEVALHRCVVSPALRRRPRQRASRRHPLPARRPRPHRGLRLQLPRLAVRPRDPRPVMIHT